MKVNQLQKAQMAADRGISGLFRSSHFSWYFLPNKAIV